MYSPKVQSLIRRLRTPQQVQHWIHSLQYNKQETMRTLPDVVKSNKAHCLEAVLAACAILEHHGHPPLILDLESADLLDHTLFLFKKNGKFGSVAMSHDVGLYGRRPVFSTIQALVRSYAIPYIDAKAAITGYGVLNLRDLSNASWRFSKRNVWYVEEALRQIPHHRFSLPPATLKYWRRRYLAWKRDHPKRPPTFYPNQHQWM